MNDQWKGKKWYCYGTSLTDSSGAGKFSRYLAEYAGLEEHNFGKGGSGIVAAQHDKEDNVKTRIMRLDDGKAEADLICLHNEKFDFSQPLELFDPDATWKRKVFTDIEVTELLVPIFYSGNLVYRVPDIQASRAYCQRQVDALWDEVKRFENPHNYYVDLSQKLWDIKYSLLKNRKKK